MNSKELAKSILEIIPPSMHKIRAEMRSGAADLTIPQFRVLAAIFRGKNHISEIAKHHGVSQPAMSKMVEGLVDRALVLRVADKYDKRNIVLSLTKKGAALYRRSKLRTQKNISKKITALAAADQKNLEQGLLLLKKIFSN